ncbi:MAG: hypothetical protein ACI8P2_004964, partial [Candidatus Latescibacterota bacterium]
EVLYTKEGVPVGKRHRELLEKVAAELALEVPW